MIKYAKFTFPQLELAEYWTNFPVFSAVLTSKVDYTDDYRSVDITLDKDKIYQISFDQSTTNTGIFIKDLLNTEAYMIEVQGKKGQDPTVYIFELEQFLHSLGEGRVFSHVLYEKPIKGQSFQSSRVLFQLEGMIKALCLRYSEFGSACLDCIENSSWRSVVVTDSEYERVHGRKEASRHAVNELFSWTQIYGLSLYKDNDIFEAIGVMMGWFYNSFDPFGRPYVRGDKASRPVGGFIFPDVPAKEIRQMLKEQGIESDFFVENPKYSIWQNLTAGIRPHTIHCVELTTPYTMLCLCVECNIKWNNPELMTVIVCDAATIDPKLKQMSGGTFQFIV